MKKQNLLLLMLIPLLFLAACNSGTNTGGKIVANEKTDTMKYSISEKPFGTYDNNDITQYTITNPSGMAVSVINYGGIITRIIVSHKNGNKRKIIFNLQFLRSFFSKKKP